MKGGKKSGADRTRNSADENSGIHELRMSLYQFAEPLTKLRMDLKSSKQEKCEKTAGTGL